MRWLREGGRPPSSIGRTRDAGKYQALYQDVEYRDATTVVLTFAHVVVM